MEPKVAYQNWYEHCMLQFNNIGQFKIKRGSNETRESINKKGRRERAGVKFGLDLENAGQQRNKLLKHQEWQKETGTILYSRQVRRLSGRKNECIEKMEEIF